MDVSFKSDKVIQYLVELKDELVRVNEKRFQKLIEVLNTYEINDDEDYKLPSGKELAKILNISNSTIIQLLKKLYQYLLFDFMQNSLEVNNCKQRVMIYIPFDEENPAIRKKTNHYHKFFTYIQLRLTHIPRIGE